MHHKTSDLEPDASHSRRTSVSNETRCVVYRHHVINRLHSQHSFVVLVSENLSNYMKRACQLYRDNWYGVPAHSIPEGKIGIGIMEEHQGYRFKN